MEPFSRNTSRYRDTLLKNTRALAKYFQTSYEYVASLKPKATKRK
jgi:hypothetical protein